MFQGTLRSSTRSGFRRVGRGLGWLMALAALATLCGSLGCAWLDPLHRRSDFDQIQKSFTQDLRWGRMDKASERVAPELRAEFKSLAPGFQKLRITDYDIIDSKLDPDLKHATVDVRYSGYRVDELVERSVTIHEDWTQDPETGKWEVKCDLAKLQRALGVPVPAQGEPLAAH